MEKKPTPQKVTAGSPPLLGSFFQGFRTGAINSSLMMGIFSVIGFAATSFAAWPLTLSAIAITTVSTGIFTGALGVKKTMDSAKAAAHAAPAVSVNIQPRSKSRALAQEMELEEAPTNLRSDWAERTGRKGSLQAQVNGIIENGSLADKDRAEAIRARDAEMAANASRA